MVRVSLFGGMMIHILLPVRCFGKLGVMMNSIQDTIIMDQLPGLDISLYRIKEDIFQNITGARNLAFTQAEEGWVWSTDIDHVIPAESIKNFLDIELNPKYYYSPARRLMKSLDGKSELIRRHGDSYIITRKMFWEVGGYDEQYTGYYYNGPYFLFRKALQQESKKVELDDVYALLFGPDVITDASPLLHQKKTRLEYISHYSERADPLQFEWEKIELNKVIA